MDGLTIEMLSTNTEEHLCMCEHLKWNGTRESKEKIMWWEKRTHMPILFHRNGMTKTHSISTFMAQLTVLNGANETFERHHSDAYNEHTTWTMESECLWCVYVCECEMWARTYRILATSRCNSIKLQAPLSAIMHRFRVLLSNIHSNWHHFWWWPTQHIFT